MYFSKAGTSTGTVYINAAHVSVSTLLTLPIVSDGTNTYECHLQLTDDPSSTTLNPNQTIGIRYSHSINGGEWEGFTKNGSGTESTADLNVTMTAAQIYLLRIELDKTKTEARFYVDGNMVGRVNSNMPSAASFGPRIILLKSAGTTAREVKVFNFSQKVVMP
jgi:hypothetical protein